MEYLRGIIIFTFVPDLAADIRLGVCSPSLTPENFTGPSKTSAFDSLDDISGGDSFLWMLDREMGSYKLPLCGITSVWQDRVY